MALAGQIALTLVGQIALTLVGQIALTRVGQIALTRVGQGMSWQRANTRRLSCTKPCAAVLPPPL